uniref:Uncharacterized protein n=1 Tax=Aureoumbra lagunensis TaxID=44058 RepID=A0A7S3JQN7_9STRA
MIVLVLLQTLCLVGARDVIGREYGLTRETSGVEESHARTILNEAETEENIDILHFAALLYLYGKGGVSQNSAQAVKLFRKAAERGHVPSQVALGVLLRHGNGVARDDYAAYAWLSRAAREGHTDGAVRKTDFCILIFLDFPDAFLTQWLLGVMYLEGFGDNTIDYEQARKWLEFSARARSPDAMHWLGVMEEYGLGRDTNYSSAARWYKKATDLGQSTAPFHLGLMHAYGRGTNQDFQRAAILFNQAASLGNAGAMFYIATMHLYGQGVPVDYDRARTWFQSAEATNDPAYATRAADARRELEISLGLARDSTQKNLETYHALNNQFPPSNFDR